MRPLPRLHAVTDARVLALPDLGRRAAAIAAAGPAVALHARNRAASAVVLAGVADRLARLARPPEAAVFVSGRPDLARALDLDGVQLAAGDLSPADARRVMPRGHVGRSVHSVDEARAAVDEGADFLLAGHVYATPSHPGEPARGVRFVEACAALGVPVIAIGGITPATAPEVRDAGAYGCAAIGALWDADDPHAAAQALFAPWKEMA